MHNFRDDVVYVFLKKSYFYRFSFGLEVSSHLVRIFVSPYLANKVHYLPFISQAFLNNSNQIGFAIIFTHLFLYFSSTPTVVLMNVTKLFSLSFFFLSGFHKLPFLTLSLSTSSLVGNVVFVCFVFLFI